jgi:Flp pilus assembly CpaF family ATPase
MSSSYDGVLVRRLVAEVGEGLSLRDEQDEAAGRPSLSGEDRRMLARNLVRTQLAILEVERFERSSPGLSEDEARQLSTAVINRLFGLARLQDYIDDADNTDIFVNGSDRVFLRRRDGRIVVAAPIADSDDEFIDIIQAQARRGRHEHRWDLASPELNMQLPSGDRLHGIMGVATRPAVSIRRHNFGISRLEQLIELGTASESLFHLLRAMVLARLNILVAGGTGAGKTTLLRCLINEIPPDQRLVTVEDSLEIGLSRFQDRHPNYVELEAREANVEGVGEVTMHSLVRAGLRMGPDRVIVGEIRGAEVVPMLLAMSQGNDGSMSTLHADSSAGVFPRLQMYMAMTPERFSIEAANLMTANAVDIVVHVSQLGTNERVITSIREVTGTEGGLVTSHEVFAPDPTGRATPAYNFSEITMARLLRAGLDQRFLLHSEASRWAYQ